MNTTFRIVYRWRSLTVSAIKPALQNLSVISSPEIEERKIFEPALRKTPKKIKSDKMLLGIAALLNLVGELSGIADEIVCDGLVFHDVYYDKEILVADLGRPYNLVFHKFSGNLFFSHTVQNGTVVDFAIVSCHVETKNCKDIDGVPGGYALAYDAGNDDIYFGGHDGIYKYNFLNKSAEFFAEEGKSIWGLFIRKNFYYIEYPTQKLFVYQDDRFELVAEAFYIEIDNFFVSKYGDVYFSNDTALYKVDKVSKHTIVLGDSVIIRQIVEDKYGDIYFCGSDGVYMEEMPYHRIKKIAVIDKAFGLAFDEQDHVIYSDVDKIYRLQPSGKGHICLSKIKNKAENKFKENIIN